MYARQHNVVSVLAMVIVSVWVFTVEGLCLFADFDGSRTTAILVASAAVVIFIVLPLSLYLTRTETKGNARLAGALSVLTAAGLASLAMVFIANSAGTRKHGIIFLAIAGLQSSFAAYTCLFSRALPSAHARPSRIRIVNATDLEDDDDDEGNDEEADENIAAVKLMKAIGGDRDDDDEDLEAARPKAARHKDRKKRKSTTKRSDNGREDGEESQSTGLSSGKTKRQERSHRGSTSSTKEGGSRRSKSKSKRERSQPRPDDDDDDDDDDDLL